MAASLSVPQPCPANWEQMTPVAGGRYCGSCEKMVVDFTGMSDPELLGWFARPTNRICGRFRPGQLGRPLSVHPQAVPPRWPAWLAAGALP
ncbi:hypothetical protein GCM10027048_08810 [Hymenobacter coalescens]